MKILHVLRIGAVFIIGMLCSAQAAEWSTEQAEVWSAIEACDGHFKAKRMEAAMDCIHEDFSGWLNSEPVPRGKDNFEKISKYFISTRDVVAGELRPIDILVYGNFAVVHYFYIEVTKDEGGNEDYSQGRWTDILIKEGGKWRWIADHGGDSPN